MFSIFSGAMYSPCASLKMCFFLSMIFKVPFCLGVRRGGVGCEQVPGLFPPSSGHAAHWAFPVHYYLILIRSGNGNGTPPQYSCLANPMDGRAWWAAVHGVAKSQTRLSDFTFTFHFHALEKEMATHSSVFAWRIPGMEEPGGLPSVGSHRIGHDWSDLAAIRSGRGRLLNHFTERQTEADRDYVTSPGWVVR